MSHTEYIKEHDGDEFNVTVPDNGDVQCLCGEKWGSEWAESEHGLRSCDSCHVMLCSCCAVTTKEADYALCDDCLEKGLKAMLLIDMSRDIYQVARRRFDVTPYSQLTAIREMIRTRFVREEWELVKKG